MLFGAVFRTSPKDRLPQIKQKRRKKILQNCVKILENKFPVNFNRNITRKMHSLMITLPKYIVENKYFYKAQKVEQAREKLHKEMNYFERIFRNVTDEPLKIFF